MTNRIRNEISHTIGDHEYLFRVSFQAILDIEDLYDGLSIHTILADIIADGITVNHLLGILKSGIAAAAQPYDEKQLINDIELEGMNNSANIAVEILTVGLNGGKQFEEEAKKK